MSRSIILFLISLLSLTMPVSAQQKARMQRRTQQEEKSKWAKFLDLNDTIPVFQGFNVSVDAVGPVGPVFGSDFFSAEVAIEVNLLRRFFPIVEVGYGRTDATNEDSGLHYQTAAPYFRAGLNYNIQYKKRLPGYIYVGARVGFTSFEYDVDGPSMTDPVWGGEVPFSFSNIRSNVSWGELLGGVKANVYKNFYMGWSFRYRFRLSITDNKNSSPWYIPGFGANDNTRFGVTYDLIYAIPWKKQSNKKE